MTTLDLTAAIDALISQDALSSLPSWRGAPLGFTSRYYPSTALDDAEARRNAENKLKPWHERIRHGWSYDRCGLRQDFGPHTIATYTADIGCAWNHPDRNDGQRITCECVGERLHLIVCDTCEQHWIDHDENTVVEAWNDHAYPGWRNLPILPAKLRGQMGTSTMTAQLEEWFEENYPPEYRIPGAPIRTDRNRFGTRHVGGYSPYGGYDLAVDEAHA